MPSPNVSTAMQACERSLEEWTISQAYTRPLLPFKGALGESRVTLIGSELDDQPVPDAGVYEELFQPLDFHHLPA